jgi:hypothetical protein
MTGGSAAAERALRRRSVISSGTGHCRPLRPSRGVANGSSSGPGADGRLPIAQDVHAEAERRGVRIAALPTAEACRLLADIESEDVYAVMHVTC